MPMSYEDDRAAPTGAMRRSGPARTLLASQGRAVQQGPANFSGRARPGYQRPGTNAQPYQPADRAFARGPGPAPAPPPPPRPQGGAGNTGTVAQPGPGQTTTPTHGPGHVAGPASIANQFSGTAMAKPAYNGMMAANTNRMTLADALGNTGQAAQPLTRWEGGSRNRDNPVEVIPQQPLTSSASVMGGTPTNMAVGGAGTAQGSVQARTIFDEGADRAADAARSAPTPGELASGYKNWWDTNVYDRGADAARDEGIEFQPDIGTAPGPVANFLPGGGGASTPIGAALRDILNLAGGDLSYASGKMSAEDMANIREQFGESSGAYSEIINRSRDIMDPAKMAEAEAAARGDLYSGINQQRDAAQRQMLASAGRGGYQSSGAQTGIYNAAMQAAQAGERGLAQDAFGRRQAATQLGISGLGAGGSALENLLQSGFTSNKELMAMLLGAGKQAKDALNPFSTLNL